MTIQPASHGYQFFFSSYHADKSLSSGTRLVSEYVGDGRPAIGLFRTLHKNNNRIEGLVNKDEANPALKRDSARTLQGPHAFFLSRLSGFMPPASRAKLYRQDVQGPHGIARQR